MQVQDALQTLVEFIGEKFTSEDLDLYISARRGKQLHILEHRLDPATSACCVALEDADVIFIRAGLSLRDHLNAYLHECSHFLLRHIPHVTEGAEGWTFESLMEKIDFQHVVRRNSIYDDPQEEAAEILATVMLELISNTEAAIPQTVLSMYGY
jgi:hypothetical protein